MLVGLRQPKGDSRTYVMRMDWFSRSKEGKKVGWGEKEKKCKKEGKGTKERKKESN